MHLFEVDAVTSVCETTNSYFVHGKYGLSRIGNNEIFSLERKTIYEGNGALLLIKHDNLTGKSLMGKRVGHITMLREDSVRLTSQFDFSIAEMLIAQNKKLISDKGHEKSE